MSGLGPQKLYAGSALALGAVAAAVAALPDVKRVAEAGVSPGAAWVALAGSTALVLGPLLLLTRAAASRLRGIAPVLLGIGLSAFPLAFLGQALKVYTHHRPLGAATFGAVALVIVSFFIAIGARLAAWAEAPVLARRLVLRFVMLVALLGSAAVVLRSLASASAHHDVIDVFRVLAASAIAWMGLNQPRVEMWARRAGALAWVALVVAGLVAARGPVRDAVRERAPVLGGPAAWL